MSFYFIVTQELCTLTYDVRAVYVTIIKIWDNVKTACHDYAQRNFVNSVNNATKHSRFAIKLMCN